MTSMVVTIDDILDQLWSENKRLLKELLFANKLKIFLMKLFIKYEEYIDGEDKHEFKQLEEEIQLKDKEIEEDSHIVDININKFNENNRQNRISKIRSNINTKKFFIHRKTCKPKERIFMKMIYDKKSRKYKCRYNGCDKMISTMAGLRYHERTYHERESTKWLKCQYIDCQFETFTDSKMLSHINVKHLNVKTFVCPISGCNKALKSKDSLQRHSLIHTNTLISCDFDGCQRRFRCKKILNQHKAQHKSVPTLTCSAKGCVEKFFTESERQRHRRIIHNFKRKRFNTKKRCVWPGCDYFGQNVSTHMEIHTGERRYPCLWPHCGKRFRDSGRLRFHMNVHNNLKPYVCRWPGCEYRCANNSNVIKHMKQIHQKL
ncbi:zinc finger protein 143-like [Oppia nitens]|uniref:zinc finger protein 143-like n=1 Tax=Oppia nitens TaxID=1686743 RepID=UPI0023DA4EB7|nr:zinc finger protein 143-like [Oppia nitens]